MTDEFFLEDIDSETQRGKRGVDNSSKVLGADWTGIGGDEVEEGVFRARSVFENRVDCGYGASQVVGIDSHCDVNKRGITGQ